VRIAVPPLTEQRRKELEVVHKICEEYKVWFATFAVTATKWSRTSKRR
jgi:ribosome recycling factor